MKPIVFLDTNVVIDFFMARKPFSIEADKLFQLRTDNRLDFCLSALTLANLAYHANRNGKSPFAVINTFLNWVEVIDLDKDIFSKTITSGFKDFEDGLQYFSALKVKGVDAIITRNEKDFKLSKIPVLSPREFLKSFS